MRGLSDLAAESNFCSEGDWSTDVKSWPGVWRVCGEPASRVFVLFPVPPGGPSLAYRCSGCSAPVWSTYEGSVLVWREVSFEELLVMEVIYS